jgi:hemolysin activation/secretion protein
MRRTAARLVLILLAASLSFGAQAQDADRMHTVRGGETLFGIAQQYALDYEDLARWNDLSAGFTIHPGQVLALRPRGASAAPPPAVAADPGQAEAWQLPSMETQTRGDATLAKRSSVFVTSIELQGNTVLSPDEISRVTAGYEGRTLTSEELQEVRHRLSKLYVDKGYISSGVIVPDQRVDDGVIRLRAIEGRVGAIEITSEGRIAESYLERRIETREGEPVSVAGLQESLQAMQQDPRIRQVNAELLPGMESGLSVLKVNVTENVNHAFSVLADNHRPASVDENRTSLRFFHRNLTGHGDVLTVEGGLTEGMNDYGFAYDFPVTAKDFRVGLYFSKTDSDIVEAPFQFLDIASETETQGIRFSRPFRTDGGSLITASLGYEYKESQSTLLGIPFSFSPGDVNGESSATIVPISVDWARSSAKSALAIRGTARIGVDTLDVTRNATGPDTEFVSILAQLNYVHQFEWRNSRLIIRSAGQAAFDPLLAFEKFALGGYSTVRGYRENQYVRDNGIFASVEYQLPLFLREDGGDRFGLRLAAFVDYGLSWDDDDDLPTSEKAELFSTGLGLLWNPSPRFHAELYYGFAIEDVNFPTETWQDRGFHFQVVYTPFGGD